MRAADFFPDFHVFWCEPATHIVALQIGIQPFDKGFVFAGIADKAGVVLNRGVYQRTGIGDKGIRSDLYHARRLLEYLLPN